MNISFHIPGPLRQFTNGSPAVRIEVLDSANLLDALQALFAAHPGLRDRILTEAGEVRQHVNIFLGNENVRHTGSLTTRLPPSAEISIVPAISGG